jgi:hypothetical protein
VPAPLQLLRERQPVSSSNLNTPHEVQSISPGDIYLKHGDLEAALHRIWMKNENRVEKKSGVPHTPYKYFAVAAAFAIVFSMAWAAVELHKDISVSSSGIMIVKSGSSAGKSVQTTLKISKLDVNSSWSDEALSVITALSWNEGQIKVDGFIRAPSPENLAGDIIFITNLGRFVVTGSSMYPANGTYANMEINEMWTIMKGA